MNQDDGLPADVRERVIRILVDAVVRAVRRGREERRVHTMKTRQERAALRTSLERETGQRFADGYFGLTTRNCSAWEWFVLKSGGDTKLARRRWKAVDMDEQLRQWTFAHPPPKVDDGDVPF